jgi:hypothetical protein
MPKYNNSFNKPLPSTQLIEHVSNSVNKAKLPVIAILIAILAATVMRFGVGFDGLYGQDGYEYLRYAQALKIYLVHGTDPGDYFWPVWYPLMGALVSFIVQDIAFSLQLISCLSLALVFIFSNKIMYLLFSETNQRSPVLFNILFLLLSPFMLRFGFLVMADMLTLALIMMSTFYFLKAAKKGKTIDLIAAGLVGTMAFMTRYASVVILAPVALYGYWVFFRNAKNAFNAIPAFVLGILPLIPHVLIRGSQSTHFIQHDWVSQWSVLNFFKNDFITRDGGTRNTLPNVIYALGGLFHPRYCFAAVLILLLRFKMVKLNGELRIIAAGLIIYLVFLAGIPYQNNRFLLMALPFFLFILYRPWLSFMQHQQKPVYVTAVVFMLVIQGALFPFGFEAVYNRNRLEKDVYTYLASKNNPDVYTMDIDVSLTGRDYHGKIYNIYANYYDQPDTNALVIFNALTMPFQWNQMNPMNNWQHFNHDYQLKEIKRFDNGWAIHQFY